METIIEGSTKLVVPGTENKAGPATRAKIFYNPAMLSNRDIAVLFGRAMAKDGMNILDALGGTGAKGIRLANELEQDISITVNDMSQDAFFTIKQNIKANRLKNVKPSNLEFNTLLSEIGFDWIEIDPFGSPVKFIDLAVRRLSRNGILSITATDTAPLCAAKPEACQRRYLATPLNTGCCHEFGLRILVGNAVRRAAVFDLGLEPLLAYYHGHYFRAYFRKRKGVKHADSGLSQMGYISWDDKKGYAVHREAPDGIFSGPLWTGDLWDPAVVRKSLGHWDDTFGKDSKRILASLETELLQPPFFFHMDQMASLSGSRPLKTDDVVNALQEMGFNASGVHYSRKGFRTDAPFDELMMLFNAQK